MKKNILFAFTILCFSNFIVSSEGKGADILDLYYEAVDTLLEHARKNNGMGYSHEVNVVTVDYKDGSIEKFYLVYSDELKKFAFQIPQEELDRKAKVLSLLRLLKGEDK